MSRRFIGSLVAVMMLAVLAVGTATGVGAASPYQCPDNTCSFSVPSYYSTLKFDDNSISFQDTNSGGVFAVEVYVPSSRATLDSLTQAELQSAQSETGYAAISNVTRTSLDGAPTRYFTFQAINSKGVRYAETVYVALYGGQEYILRFATTPDSADDFIASATDVLDSWSFT